MNPQSLPLSSASHLLKNNAPAHGAGTGSGTWDGCLTTSFSYGILHLQTSSLWVKKICDFSLYKDIQEFYEVTLLNSQKSYEQKIEEANQVAEKWEKTTSATDHENLQKNQEVI
uniref:Uncharacterized protein n=10 Tax=Neoaves TaxID=3078114 RepID=A0A8B9RXC5_9AVES